MQHFSIFERIIHRIKEDIRPLFASMRRKRLSNVDFTIISNNCWGGVCYEYYGLQKNSPTVGLYFFADDYIKFISKLEYYCSLEIKMINAKDSKYSEELAKRKQLEIPIGVLDDIEIIFLHYKNADVAKSKWTKRTKRINWNNIIYKFSYMNDCTIEKLQDFYVITKNKKSFMFVPNIESYMKLDNMVIMKEISIGEQIENDTFYWNKYFDVELFINTGLLKTLV